MKRSMAVVGVLLLVSSMAMAAIEAGMKEVAVQFSFQEIKSDTEGSSEDGMYNMIGQLTLNYFMASHWSFGVQTLLNVNASETTKADGTSELQPGGTAFVMARTDLYLGGAEWATIPYVGGHGGYSIYAFQSAGAEKADWQSEIAYGGQGGLKIFATERVSWNLEGDVTIFETGDSSSDDELRALGIEPTEMKLRVTSLLIGFSYYF